MAIWSRIKEKIYSWNVHGDLTGVGDEKKGGD